MDQDQQRSTHSPHEIAARLSIGQRMTIAGLDRDHCVLGCSEPTAKRLERSTPKRPALIISRPGVEFREFALNDLGMAVKAVLS